MLKLKFQKSDQEKLTLKQGSTLVTTAQVVSQFIENRKSEKIILTLDNLSEPKRWV